MALGKLQKRASSLPDRPGVYLYLDKNKKILYVGRATSLKRRVTSYFQKNLESRLLEMVKKAKEIKYISTDTVLEAIILEANLIKKHWPKYNIKDRDDRSFIYIVIPKTEWPYPMVMRRRELEKYPPSRAEIFGPYQSLMLVRKFLRLIRKVFPYSTCRPLSGEACFNYQIGLCPGACVGKISNEQYQESIKNIIALLRGQKKSLLKKLTKQNPAQALALKHLQDVALLSIENEMNMNFDKRLTKIEGYDISHLTGRETVGSMVVFVNGAADKNQYRLFKIRTAPANDDLRALEEVLIRRFNHKEWLFPDYLMIDGGRPQINFLTKVLKDKNINIPLVGISKYGGDELVFPPKSKKALKDMVLLSKNVFLRVRDEAHRFALSLSRRQRRLKK
ncbi:MAG: GIY-YIG nuclease family protein [Patescibacteria group bacterium]|nr:GIY-YIG nuclease family protein [Patescibacteria group bacterium]MDD5121466.1 GIY-YIG nuclease family protein [Patescibacteria group bacterium]MDD5222221.1 GIY-YIG nuclease family protein [Patescibacteria group bacterium]MDD5396372.1 GIY-YIG nuclease family protein [Patescibacteria group bacterium]